MDVSRPVPKAILRGHKAQVHAAAFLRQNERLATGDAEGWVVFWDLAIMRPRAVWRAHENAILGIRGWGQDKVITHGRDHKLVVWKLGLPDEERQSVALPLEDVSTPRPQPWILHLLEVNTMNFCSFAACSSSSEEGSIERSLSAGLVLAVPNTLASEAIDIYTLPTQARIHTIKPGEKNGMAMSLSLFHHEGDLTLIAAFENGFVSVHRLESDDAWTMTYRSQAHSQPVLSIDVHPDLGFFLTSAADSIIAKHPIAVARQEISSTFDPSQIFIEGFEPESNLGPSPTPHTMKNSSSSGIRSAGKRSKEWEHPLKVVNTKHSGQQSLRVRSDGRIFATAGWDSKLRVYSAKSLKELAVLSWHKAGVYAVAFSVVGEPDTPPGAISAPPGTVVEDDGQKIANVCSTKASEAPGSSANLVKGAGMSVRDRRIQLAKTAHWIAAGAKDGKVSLWDIY